MSEISDPDFCAYCRAPMSHKTRHKKRFCSSRCRASAWDAKRAAGELAKLQEFADRVIDLVQEFKNRA